MMLAFVGRRVLAIVPVILLVSALVFSLLHLSGEDPVEMMLGESGDPRLVAAVRSELGLDRPLYLQYFDWLTRVVSGDLGRSIQPARFNVSQLILQRLPVTLELSGLAMIASLCLGLPLGVIAAVKRRTWFDLPASIASVVGIALPDFVRGLLLIYVFALYLRWVPASGYVSPADDLGANLKSMALPAATLALYLSAFVMRVTRSSILDVLGQEYIRTARAKGLPERLVIVRHALKAGLIPIVTVVGLQLGYALGGAFVVETVFALPGVGRMTLDAIYARDLPVVQGGVLVTALGFILANFLVDLLYGYLDPRIRYA